MITALLIIVAISASLVVFGVLWRRVRSSTNFNLIYVRALRVEGSKELAIAAGLEHLRTFLTPFDQLSDNQIAMIAKLFSDVDEPHKVLQPVLQLAERSKSLAHMDEEALKSWKKTWLQQK